MKTKLKIEIRTVTFDKSKFHIFEALGQQWMHRDGETYNEEDFINIILGDINDLIETYHD